jgi:DNA transformation protein
MPMPLDPFLIHLLELLEAFGPITHRRMFGGYGIYKSGKIFALVIENEAYFKASEEAKIYFQSFGSEPFTYLRNNKPVSLSYWKLMPEAMEDAETLKKWVNHAQKQ